LNTTFVGGGGDELLVLVGVRAPPTNDSTSCSEFPPLGTADPPAPDIVIDRSLYGTGVIPFLKTWSETTHPPPIFDLDVPGSASNALIEVSSPQ